MVDGLELIESYVKQLKGKFTKPLKDKDYHWFTLLCMKYFFYNEPGVHFDAQTAIEEALTDGANDGGIDAVFNDPSSETNDVIIVQSKYYQKTSLTQADIAGEVNKIKETLSALGNGTCKSLNSSLVTAYANAIDQMEDDGMIHIRFFTAYKPHDKKTRNKLVKPLNDAEIKYGETECECEISFQDDIYEQIQLCENGKTVVESDELQIDKAGNFLVYEDSLIVNVSAKSLQNLHFRKRNSLLGMNLRYYVKQKAVDDGIEKSILGDPENFWYKNNGIVIACDHYEINENVLKLYGFSIINGGQTTNRIGNTDIERDFYLQCKIVKLKGKNKEDKQRFSGMIAEATNSQKPVKISDLKANTPEQQNLRQELNKYHVYYILKRGDKAPKGFENVYDITKLEQVGKIGLAGILQMPGSARSSSKKMYNDDFYPFIFGKEARPGVIADLLRVDYCYELFKKSVITGKGHDKNVVSLLKYGKTFSMSCLMFFCKIASNVFAYPDIEAVLPNLGDDDISTALLKKLRAMGDIKRLGSKKMDIDEEQKLYFAFFAALGDVFKRAFANAIATTGNKSLSPSNFMKVDANYYRYVIPKLWEAYDDEFLAVEPLKNAVQNIFGKI